MRRTDEEQVRQRAQTKARARDCNLTGGGKGHELRTLNSHEALNCKHEQRPTSSSPLSLLRQAWVHPDIISLKRIRA